MKKHLPRRQRRPGEIVDARELATVGGSLVAIPDPAKIVHLQFRRFAGCPVCALHLRSFVRRAADLEAAGVREVVVFHSPAGELARHTADLPFDVIADPGKRLYAEFGVTSGVRAMLDPRAWPAIVTAVLVSAAGMIREGRPAPSLFPHGGRYGLPADFLIAPDGRMLDAKYGQHADDHWSVDDVLERAGAARASGWTPVPSQVESAGAAHAASDAALLRRTWRGALAVLALTSIHHAYGAYAYATPWRLHAIPAAVVTAIVLAAFLTIGARARSGGWARAARTAFAAVALVVPVALFGLYEGGYNHVLKNVLFFAGASRTVLDGFYDPSLYVLPDDAVFEGTGMLQALPAIAGGIAALRLLSRALRPQRAAGVRPFREGGVAVRPPGTHRSFIP